ncbi:hypothetical protein OHZ10_21895 [Burkholderia arboris]|uniref:Uncharacterized protein n=1 Tax=Burkholderia arboris TaxID=488730 RepID=A0ABZ3DSM9_9BURK|nr:hypothetical protein [Burkholderia arboris]MCA8495085.1 hypothetical protein [Burkholderia arboris]
MRRSTAAMAGPESLPYSRDFGRRIQISVGITPCKGVRRRALGPNQLLAAQPAQHHPVHVRATETAEAAQVVQHQPAIGALEPAIVQPARHRGDPRPARAGIGCGHKFQRLGSVEYAAHLFDGANSCFIQIDDHP